MEKFHPIVTVIVVFPFWQRDHNSLKGDLEQLFHRSRKIDELFGRVFEVQSMVIRGTLREVVERGRIERHYRIEHPLLWRDENIDRTELERTIELYPCTRSRVCAKKVHLLKFQFQRR
jgi:hypothetical protein